MALPVSKLIPLKVIQDATNNFHEDNLISSGGGFGPAYKGQLLESGIKIVARKLHRSYFLGEVEFLTEVSVLSELNHPNLVSFIGYCDENGKKILVTSYEAKGSLSGFLSSPKLTWARRLRICLGVARALKYLHSDKERDYAVIHRNINSHTILLDKNWEPKLSGFEISIKQPVNRKDLVFLSEPTGMEEYRDPAIKRMGGVTHKGDLYSFGVVLFEILCGRLAFDENMANEFLAPLARSNYENATLQDIIHPYLLTQMSPRSRFNYAKVAYSCIKEEPEERPDIRHIGRDLKEALKIQLQREDTEKNFEHLKIPLAHLLITTKSFSEAIMIDRTKSYSVYRAEYNHPDKELFSSTDEKNEGEASLGNNIVVVRRIHPTDESNESNGEGVFYTEVKMHSIVKHRNIVKLLGFCVEGREMIIVFENFFNDYLGDYFDNKVQHMHTLTWEMRLRICIDIAQVLYYLHYEMEEQKVVINRQVQNNNIVLGNNWVAKIHNFGWSIFLPPNQEDDALYRVSFVGTPYYFDPEYRSSFKLKRESDVYGFGVVMFEILCGKLAYDNMYIKDGNEGLAFVARRSFIKRTLEEMIDPLIKEEIGERNFSLDRGPIGDSLRKFIEIAYACVAETQGQRPTIKRVLNELKRALSFLKEEVQCSDTEEWGRHFTPYNFVKRLQGVGMDPLVDELGKLPEHKLTHEILVKDLEHLKIPLTDIKVDTSYFSEKYKIRFHEIYNLYRAELHFDREKPSSVERLNKDQPPEWHDTVVIKRFSSKDNYDVEEIFCKEVQILSTIKHHNIVKLIGFCVENSEKILVIEYLSNGYLAEYFENDNKMLNLTWEKRLKICIDVAQALNYLHFEMEGQKMIINPLRSEYIALDENFRAKIADFAQSITRNQDDEVVNLGNVAGLKCYTDPEYMMHGKLKRESDVYSFGVVLLEILCGKLANSSDFCNENDEGLAYVARKCIKEGTLGDMIDPKIREEISLHMSILTRGPNKDSIQTFIEIAYKCVAETQDHRPTMKVIIAELEKALDFQMNNNSNMVISLEDIKLATQDFHENNYIGGGGFGKVYLGKLQDGNGSNNIVAKRLYGRGKQQFLTELQILWEYKHQNVISLLGYCDQNNEKIVVYEYASKGSLDGYLNDASLTWLKRLNICIDVASALDFLHGGARKQAKVVHRDIKTANILLHDNWKAKLSDFGLSLISGITAETDYVIDHACGTNGYVDPLYAKSKILTIESDVYSFGVVLCELLCGRSTNAIYKRKGQYLPYFFRKRFEEGKVNEVVFKEIREQIVTESLSTFQEIVYRCLHNEREKRPKTNVVLSELKKALDFQVSRSGSGSTSTTSITNQMED